MTTSRSRPITFDPRIPFSRADARRAGVAEDALRTSAYQRIFFDTYLCSSVKLTTAVRAAAAIEKVGGQAFASHHTAASLWGIPVPVDGLIHVTAAKDEGRTRCRGILTHQPLEVAGRLRVRDGVRLSAPEQVLCELAAARVGLVDLVVAGDAILRAELATCETLALAVASMNGPGVRAARRALGYLRDGVDSPMESRLRMLLVLAGLPEPDVNVILRSFDGTWDRRFDMCYAALRLIVEYDGSQHGALVHRESDIHRREHLERLGYAIVPVTALGIYRDPATTLRRVADAIRERGGRVPRRFQPEWRQHFPGQPWRYASS